MSLTGTAAARFPKYLWARCVNDYEDLDENGHAPETLDLGAPEHDAGGNAGWLNCITRTATQSTQTNKS